MEQSKLTNKNYHAIKIENFPELNTSEADDIVYMLTEVAEELDLQHRIDNIECRRRDGFIPHSWNNGGIQSHGYTDIGGIVGSGMFSGSDKLNTIVEEYYEQNCKDALEQFIENNNLSPELTHDDLTDEQREECWEIEDEYNLGNYASVCVEYQGRYLGYENGEHEISLNVFLSASDAPYHRQTDDDVEIILKFKKLDCPHFKKQLENAIEKMQDFIGSLELY